LIIKAFYYKWKLNNYKVVYEDEKLLKVVANDYELYKNGKLIKRYKNKRQFLINNITKQLIYSKKES